MTLEALSAVSMLLDIPEDCIPESGLAIVTYVNTEGKQMVQCGFLGEDADLFQVIGSLEVIKTRLADGAYGE